MKKSILCLLLLLFAASAGLRAQADASLETFGKAFVKAISQKEKAAFEPLMISEDAARATMAATAVDTADQRQEMERFREALPKMQANFARAHEQLIDFMKGQDLSKASFVKIEREGEPKQDVIVDKTDLVLYFKIKRKQFVIDIDDCVKTVQGWRFTAKFHAVTAEE